MNTEHLDALADVINAIERAHLLAHTAAKVRDINSAHACNVLTTLATDLEVLHNDVDVLHERLRRTGPPVPPEDAPRVSAIRREAP